MRTISIAAAMLLSFISIACDEQFDPRTLVTELRVLGIAAEPVDVAPGEVTEITALVVEPEGEPVTYLWELCIIDDGPDSQYACRNELLGLDEELLAGLVLGTTPTVNFAYFVDGEALQEACEAALSDVGEVPDFVELPDCDEGLDVRIRLSVRAGDVEKIAVKSLFLWFEAPDDSERNHNPIISGLEGDGESSDDELEPIPVTASQQVAWQVRVDEDSLETFTVEFDDGTEGETRDEQVLFSWFSTNGLWDHEVTFSQEGDISLEEAGSNVLTVPRDMGSGDEIQVFFVIRDGRGGSDWRRRVLIVE